MQVRKASAAPTPEYPDKAGFQPYRHLLGAAVIGAGLAAAACEPKPRLGGSPIAPAPTKVEPPPRVRGRIVPVPKPEPVKATAPTKSAAPVRKPGAVMVPPLGGVPLMSPSPLDPPAG